MSDPIRWHDLLVVDAGGGRVSLLSPAGAVVGTVGVGLPAPWTLARTDADADTLDHVWACDAGEVRVRHAWGALWHLTLSHRVRVGADPTPLLWLESGTDAALPWLWGAGAQARAVLWLPWDAGLLELRQVEGEAGVVEGPGGHRGLALAATPSGGARWRIEPLPTLAPVVAGLPSWLPRLVVDAGDTITLERPDAGIETGLATVQEDLVTEITVPAGVHRVVVHESRGAVRLDVHGAPLPSDDLTARAARLARLDPRSLGPAQLWLAEHAAEHFDADFLDAVAERALSLAVSAASPDPFALAAAAMGLSRADPRDVADLMADLTAAASKGSELPVGSLLARGWLARAAVLAGLPRVSIPAGRPRGRTLAALEHAVVTGRAPQVRRLVAWALDSLGRELPGEPAQGQLGPLVGLLRFAPGRWLSEQGGAGTLALRERQAISGSDDEVAWLWW